MIKKIILKKDYFKLNIIQTAYDNDNENPKINIARQKLNQRHDFRSILYIRVKENAVRSFQTAGR